MTYTSNYGFLGPVPCFLFPHSYSLIFLFPNLTMLDISFRYLFEMQKFFIIERCASEVRIEGIASDIILQIIVFCTSDIHRHILYIISGM